jgi:serine/threonine protein phosphatase PrpC
VNKYYEEVSKTPNLHMELNTAKVIERIFDQILAKDTTSSEGIGTDNMTCVLAYFKNN